MMKLLLLKLASSVLSSQKRTFTKTVSDAIWLDWTEWSDCFCQKVEQKFIRIKNRGCHCKNNNGCTSWCGKKSEFYGVETCKELATYSGWTHWSLCEEDQTHQIRVQKDCAFTGCQSVCTRLPPRSESRECPKCENGWEELADIDGTCYKWLGSKSSNMARKECAREGASVLLPHSDQEMQIWFTELIKRNDITIWVHVDLQYHKDNMIDGRWLDMKGMELEPLSWDTAHNEPSTSGWNVLQTTMYTYINMYDSRYTLGKLHDAGLMDGGLVCVRRKTGWLSGKKNLTVRVRYIHATFHTSQGHIPDLIMKDCDETVVSQIVGKHGDNGEFTVDPNFIVGFNPLNHVLSLKYHTRETSDQRSSFSSIVINLCNDWNCNDYKVKPHADDAGENIQFTMKCTGQKDSNCKNCYCYKEAFIVFQDDQARLSLTNSLCSAESKLTQSSEQK